MKSTTLIDEQDSLALPLTSKNTYLLYNNHHAETWKRNHKMRLLKYWTVEDTRHLLLNHGNDSSESPINLINSNKILISFLMDLFNNGSDDDTTDTEPMEKSSGLEMGDLLEWALRQVNSVSVNEPASSEWVEFMIWCLSHPTSNPSSWHTPNLIIQVQTLTSKLTHHLSHLFKHSQQSDSSSTLAQSYMTVLSLLATLPDVAEYMVSNESIFLESTYRHLLLVLTRAKQDCGKDMGEAVVPTPYLGVLAHFFGLVYHLALSLSSPSSSLSSSTAPEPAQPLDSDLAPSFNDVALLKSTRVMPKGLGYVTQVDLLELIVVRFKFHLIAEPGIFASLLLLISCLGSSSSSPTMTTSGGCGGGGGGRDVGGMGDQDAVRMKSVYILSNLYYDLCITSSLLSSDIGSELRLEDGGGEHQYEKESYVLKEACRRAITAVLDSLSNETRTWVQMKSGGGGGFTKKKKSRGVWKVVGEIESSSSSDLKREMAYRCVRVGDVDVVLFV